MRERKVFLSAGQKIDRALLSIKWSRAAQITQLVGRGCNRRYRRLRSRGIALRRDLFFDSVEKDQQLFGFVISLGLLTHLLEVLRSVADAIRHRG
jgi:hypothetical protein